MLPWFFLIVTQSPLIHILSTRTESHGSVFNSKGSWKVCRFSQIYFRDSSREEGWTSFCICGYVVITKFKIKNKTKQKLKAKNSYLLYSMS